VRRRERKSTRDKEGERRVMIEASKQNGENIERRVDRKRTTRRRAAWPDSFAACSVVTGPPSPTYIWKGVVWVG
jgi:hypothetical protein